MHGPKYQGFIRTGLIHDVDFALNATLDSR
jgi:hypothetical protein